MGTLAGHLLPGTFFIIFGVWWSFITSMRFIQSKRKFPLKKNSRIGYKGSGTMPCICLPCAKARRTPIESWIKLIFGSIGLAGEIITGFKWINVPAPQIDKIFDKSSNMNLMSDHDHEGHVHRRDLSNIPNVPVKTLWIAYSNVQHSTMYIAFMLGSIVEILVHYKHDLPARLEYVFGIVAFAIEGFLFANHLHGRSPLDIQLHTFLVYAIYGCVVSGILECYKPNQILFTYTRIFFTILQGIISKIYFFKILFQLKTMLIVFYST